MSLRMALVLLLPIVSAPADAATAKVLHVTELLDTRAVPRVVQQCRDEEVVTHHNDTLCSPRDSFA